METKHALNNPACPQRGKQKNIVDAAGSNWIALAVDAEQAALLKLIVPQGRTIFPCPHLIADDQGKNWLLRPDYPQNLLTGNKNSQSAKIKSGRGPGAVMPGGKLVKTTGLRIGTVPRKPGIASDNSVEKFAVSVRSAQKTVNSSLDLTAVRSPATDSNVKSPVLKPAGKPPAVALAGRPALPGKPVVAGKRLATPTSVFAPKMESEITGLPARAVGCAPAPESAPASANETYLVKPLWQRLKAKANRGTAVTEQTNLGDIEILTEPVAAWKLWLRRVIPPVSVALLALGSWQLAVG
ncbi:hypothetical protein [Varibaculum cambriense]|uniref:hypothetical protein n=1 Tax=Varibaculum cambriense TaxID=184870 RepID=UPI0029100152|nr:hypothetical protein [Varibaculum cambriense]MDU5541606.1 hypothetical protein [Varibaculum cambriense]